MKNGTGNDSSILHPCLKFVSSSNEYLQNSKLVKAKLHLDWRKQQFSTKLLFKMNTWHFSRNACLLSVSWQTFFANVLKLTISNSKIFVASLQNNLLFDLLDRFLLLGTSSISKILFASHFKFNHLQKWRWWSGKSHLSRNHHLCPELQSVPQPDSIWGEHSKVWSSFNQWF